MKEYWIRIENWLQENAPHLLRELNIGASQADIDALEALVGAKLPTDFIDFYKIHNGQAERQNWEGLIDYEELLSTAAIEYQWKVWKELLDDGVFVYDGVPSTSEPDAGIKNDWWNPLWIPFTYDGSGNHICIDLDPDVGGNYGQVMRMWHDAGDRPLYANSFSEYIEKYVDDLEAGKFVYSTGLGIILKEDV